MLNCVQKFKFKKIVNLNFWAKVKKEKIVIKFKIDNFEFLDTICDSF